MPIVDIYDKFLLIQYLRHFRKRMDILLRDLVMIVIDSCQENSKTKVCFGASTIMDVLFTNQQNTIHE